MKKAFLLVFIMAMAIAAQTNIPFPSVVAIPSGFTFNLSQIQNIGDFDGDGAEDIAVFWNGSNMSSNNPNPNYWSFWGIYSIKKGTYLMIDTSSHSCGSGIINSGRLTSIPTNWVAIGTTYYIWNGSPILAKKKARP
jgi:hypothetical protein